MNLQNGITNLITSEVELMDLIAMEFLDNTRHEEVYFIGSKISVLMNQLVSVLGQYDNAKHMKIILPAVTSVGLLFRSNVSRHGASVRVTNVAMHDLIVTEKKMLFMSIHTAHLSGNQIMAIVSENSDLCRQAVKYAHSMWENAHPLR